MQQDGIDGVALTRTLLCYDDSEAGANLLTNVFTFTINELAQYDQGAASAATRTIVNEENSDQTTTIRGPRTNVNLSRVISKVGGLY